MVSYYAVSVPMGYFYTFVVGGTGLGLNGLWYGMFTGQFVLCLLYQFFISYKFDWDKIVAEAKQRTERDQQLIEMEDKPAATTAV